MKGFGYVLVGVIIPLAAYVTVPILYAEWLETTRTESDGEARSPPKPVSPRAAASRSTLSDSSVAAALALANLSLLGSVFVLARFNRRLVHSVRLYPGRRALALETVGLFRAPRTRIVALDSIIPPLARSGQHEAIRCKMISARHPTPAIESAEGASDSPALSPSQAFHLFPLPNVAGVHSDYTPSEKEVLEQFWLRTLTTNLHTTEQMERLAKINVVHGK
jgi:hypothetical protein